MEKKDQVSSKSVLTDQTVPESQLRMEAYKQVVQALGDAMKGVSADMRESLMMTVRCFLDACPERRDTVIPIAKPEEVTTLLGLYLKTTTPLIAAMRGVSRIQKEHLMSLAGVFVDRCIAQG